LPDPVLERLARTIVDEVVKTWWRWEAAEKGACVPHLGDAVATLARLPGAGNRAPLVEQFSRRMGSLFPETRRVAARALGLAGAAGNETEVITLLLKSAADRQPQVRRAAVDALGPLCADGAAHPQVVNLLTAILKEDLLPLRVAAARSLQSIQAAGQPAVGETMAQLAAQDERVRYALELAGLSPAAVQKPTSEATDAPSELPKGFRPSEDWVLRLYAALDDRDPRRRSHAVRAFRALSSGGVRVVLRERRLRVRTVEELAGVGRPGTGESIRPPGSEGSGPAGQRGARGTPDVG